MGYIHRVGWPLPAGPVGSPARCAICGRSATVCEGQGDDEAGAMAQALALRVDTAAVGVHDGAGDAQADAAATGAWGVGAGAVDAIEALEDLLELVGGDALAGIGHRYL